MTLSQIECFIEIARTGSFSKAAGNLFMTQQGASNQIRSLEKELGFPVFVRKNKGV
ncbi:MAG: LysR family transcriptional regulator, partial [Lachnospiraceae bacterium]|nr:LysR family transcriptional regulator [Lachnospiraceae bacterium]